MDHREMQELLPAYLDKELDISTTMALQRHLDHCPECQREYAQQSALSARVKQEAIYFEAPAPLSKRIAAALPQERPRLRRTKYWSFDWFNAGAALMTLAMAAWSIGLYVNTPSASQRLTEEVIANHVRSLQVDHLSDVASSDQHTIKPWFNGKLDFSPPVIDLAPQGFALVGGRLDYLRGHAVAVLIYRRNQHPINLYVWPISAHDTALQEQFLQGYHLAHWTQHGMAYWAISDVAANELENFTLLLRTAISN